MILKKIVIVFTIAVIVSMFVVFVYAAFYTTKGTINNNELYRVNGIDAIDADYYSWLLPETCPILFERSDYICGLEPVNNTDLTNRDNQKLSDSNLNVDEAHYLSCANQEYPGINNVMLPLEFDTTIISCQDFNHNFSVTKLCTMNWLIQSNNPAPLPEPSTFFLFFPGLFGIACLKKRKGEKRTRG